MQLDLQTKIRQAATPRVVKNVTAMCEQLYRNSAAYGISDFSGLFVGQVIHRSLSDLADRKNPRISLLMNYHEKESLLVSPFLMDFEKAGISQLARRVGANVAENFGGYALREIIFSTDSGSTIANAVKKMQMIENQHGNAGMRFFEFKVGNDFTKNSVTVYACELGWDAPELPSLG